MKQYVDKISELIKQKGIRHEIHSFDSGAFMVDVWINKDFYCIQLDENKFGISKVTEDIDFSTISMETRQVYIDVFPMGIDYAKFKNK